MVGVHTKISGAHHPTRSDSFVLTRMFAEKRPGGPPNGKSWIRPCFAIRLQRAKVLPKGIGNAAARCEQPWNFIRLDTFQQFAAEFLPTLVLILNPASISTCTTALCPFLEARCNALCLSTVSPRRPGCCLSNNSTVSRRPYCAASSSGDSSLILRISGSAWY